MGEKIIPGDTQTNTSSNTQLPTKPGRILQFPDTYDLLEREFQAPEIAADIAEKQRIAQIARNRIKARFSSNQP